MRRIIKTYVSQAFGVLAAVEHQVCGRPEDKEEGVEGGIYVQSYSNGREHGFHLSTYPEGRAVSFAQYRNSDDIVVYYGEDTDFDGDRIATQACFERAKFFKSGAWERAATFIVRHLIGPYPK